MEMVEVDITREKYDAVLFDLDGVLTDTAKVHATCWKRLFDAFLKKRAEAKDFPFAPFDIDTDYRLYVDGKPRYDGVRDFLKSRGVNLEEGSIEDPPGDQTIAALGNRKDEMVKAAIDEEGVKAYESSVTLVRRLHEVGIRCAVVSSSYNCERALKAADIADLFDERIDGQVIDGLGLRGKPAPDAFLEAARRLEVKPARTVVVEDAISGVQAGRAGKFALVIGVARKGDAAELGLSGAHVVVQDLEQLPLPSHRDGE
jgi:beta-phosphoglucomutase family hydrolase